MWEFYSVEQVAGLLDLHVKTVRGYVRDGRLKATRVGKQYRVAREDLEAFTGSPAPPPVRRTRYAEVSAIVQIDALSPEAMTRLTNTVMALALSRDGSQGRDRLRVETVYDEERATLKIIVLGALDTTADLLKVINTLIEQPQ
ncbi:helix-turn-helix domain-containing protein [Streptomyces sp. MnatMP-M17]|uniref:helix-turn-helix domain-containing protein n=1 Tax=unclassified Streptomyces TaxID=2593676 RepID=UPI00081E49DC|nr:helix-turn-helix domain-containing protein [Streptomyces sp. MnatMP-M17]MYZ36538.1 helix-turn-helix domain-containing protein [Streptomyces sp. SID4917]SCF84381.1 DNA binding domain-containing protein, excisionase family [Streptomyces sp. MnatMP-M17]